MKNLSLPTLFLCCTLSLASEASETLNWCGTYFENEGHGFIRLARVDLDSGSSSCSMSEYNKRVSSNGHYNVALDFTKNRSTVNKWRKFDNHLIEVRGKYYNGSIISTRFIRDIGI